MPGAGTKLIGGLVGMPNAVLYVDFFEKFYFYAHNSS